MKLIKKAVEAVATVVVALSVTLFMAFIFQSLADKHKEDTAKHPCVNTVMACAFK